LIYLHLQIRRISPLLLLVTSNLPKTLWRAQPRCPRATGNGKITVLNDSDEEEVREQKTTGTEDAAASATVNPASTAFADANDAHAGAKMIIVMIRAPIRRLATTTAVEMTPMSLRLPRQEGAEAAVLQGELQWFCITVPLSLCAEKLG
jgi:hypothetical protein